jgi:hypothetical protein
VAKYRLVFKTAADESGCLRFLNRIRVGEFTRQADGDDCSCTKLTLGWYFTAVALDDHAAEVEANASSRLCAGNFVVGAVERSNVLQTYLSRRLARPTTLVIQLRSRPG